MVDKLQVPNGGVLRLHWTAGGVLMSNNIGFDGAAAHPPTQAIADSMATALRAAFVSSGMGSHYRAADSGLVTVSIKSVDQVDLVEFTGTGSVQAGSGAVSDMLPWPTSLVITERTQFSGKQWRGRIYFGGFTEADSDTGANANTQLETDALAFVNAIRSTLTSNQYRHCLLQRHLPVRTDKKGNTLPERVAHAEPIISVTVRNTHWGSQRRRNRRK